ncbi:hypothetical protein K502DRAFT_322688 [Neoconidiobolus thromboides FSU 785]|nr:hypothetical protein K502DRAFT_322688 [Neoconidiobolus thromboides FSU 785]
MTPALTTTNNTQKSNKNVIETILVYGHILQIVTSFTSLLILFNVIILSNNYNQLYSQNIITNNYLIYGFIIYISLLTQTFGLLFLFIMIRTRFKYNQAGIPVSHSSYANFLLISHLIIGFHWFLATLILFQNNEHIFSLSATIEMEENLEIISKLVYRIYDLIWLIKFLAGINLVVWTYFSAFIAIFIHKCYSNVFEKLLLV